MQERGKEAMEDACQVLTVAGVRFEVEALSADAPLAIARIAVERHCDFILMGTNESACRFRNKARSSRIGHKCRSTYQAG